MKNPSGAARQLPFQGRHLEALPEASPERGGLIPSRRDEDASRRGGPPKAVERFPAEALGEIRSMRAELSDLRALVLSQNALLERLARAQTDVRITRAQERSLREAVRSRAAELAEREALPRRAVSGAIRRTLRELTGCRALGDIPAGKYDAMLLMVLGWDMPGALRRIRKECAR